MRGHGGREHDLSPWPTLSAHYEEKAAGGSRDNWFHRGSNSIVWEPRSQSGLQWKKHAFLPCLSPGNSGAS